jgi:hypothetical protein
MATMIETIYRPATTCRGSRIEARYDDGKRVVRVTVPFPHEYQGVNAHRVAATALVKKHLPMDRGRRFVYGETRRGYVIVKLNWDECDL